MRKFKFRLQRVLQHRETIREEKKQELFLKNRALYEAEAKMQELQNAMLSIGDAQSSSGAESYYLSGLYGYRLQEETAAQVIAIAKAKQAASEAREAYIEASKEAKILESLKQKRLKEYEHALQHEEHRDLDEMNIRKGNTMTGTLNRE